MANEPNLGGMALPNGVAMRLPGRWAWAFYTKEGELVVEDTPAPAAPPGAWRAPLLRGLWALGDAYQGGARAMQRATAALLSSGEEEAPEWAVTLAVVLGVGLALALFVLLPGVLAALLVGRWPALVSPVSVLFKVGLLLGYIALLDRFHPHWGELKRFHGAEHKVVRAYEVGDLSLETARRMSRFHPRCGTSYLVYTFLLATAVFYLIPFPGSVLAQVLGRLALTPLLLGLGYEVLVWVSRNQDRPGVALLHRLGMAFQALTVAEPEERHLRAALAAAERALGLDEAADEVVADEALAS